MMGPPLSNPSHSPGAEPARSEKVLMMEAFMSRPAWFRIVALSGAVSLLILVGGPSRAAPPLIDDEDDEPEHVSELDEVRTLIEQLDLKEAEDAYKAAKKELGSRKREKGVKAALKQVEKNLEALEEFEKAKEAFDKGKVSKALKFASKVIREHGELLFASEAEKLYSELKGKVFYMINDFESEESRNPDKVVESQSGATVEVISDRRLSIDGRHALKIHFDARGEGVKRGDTEAYRGVRIKTPEGFARDLEGLKALSFSIFSYGKSNAKVTLIIRGGGASSYAEYPGLVLNFVRWRPYTVRLNQFKFRDSFQWRDARDIEFFTREGPEANFIVDDLKFIR